MADTWDSFFKKEELPLRLAIDAVAIEVEEILKDELKNMWYRNPSNDYVRTYDVLNSITRKKIEKVGKNSFKIVVHFDEAKIRSNRVEGSGFGQHQSFDGSDSYEGMSIGSWVVYWIDQGQNSPVYSWDGINFVEATMDRVSTIGSKIDSRLRAYGYDVTVSF